MATDLLFPFWDILVETIFGSVALAVVGIAMTMFLILLICRTSWTFTVFWMTFYFTVMATAYVGALGLVLAFFLAFIYAIIALMRLIAGTWLNM